MSTRPIITLTTDFGLKDPFVGIMKGVILGINPEAEIIDISHNISPQNILEAAHVITMGYRYFPSFTIHVVVVDPGVGGRRMPLLVSADNHYFIGPDNGVFTFIFEEHKKSSLKVINITASHYFLPINGPTFHGRDIFVPVAAWLSKGIDSARFGETINDYVTIPLSKPKAISEMAFEGVVIYIDNFGNAITNITRDDLENLSLALSRGKIKILYKDNQLNLSSYYAEAVDGTLSAVVNSFGFIELFTYKGNASSLFDIKIGDKVVVTIHSEN